RRSPSVAPPTLLEAGAHHGHVVGSSLPRTTGPFEQLSGHTEREPVDWHRKPMGQVPRVGQQYRVWAQAIDQAQVRSEMVLPVVDPEENRDIGAWIPDRGWRIRALDHHDTVVSGSVLAFDMRTRGMHLDPGPLQGGAEMPTGGGRGVPVEEHQPSATMSSRLRLVAVRLVEN